MSRYSLEWWLSYIDSNTYNQKIFLYSKAITIFFSFEKSCNFHCIQFFLCFLLVFLLYFWLDVIACYTYFKKFIFLYFVWHVWNFFDSTHYYLVMSLPIICLSFKSLPYFYNHLLLCVIYIMLWIYFKEVQNAVFMGEKKKKKEKI